MADASQAQINDNEAAEPGVLKAPAGDDGMGEPHKLNLDLSESEDSDE